jgi:hypothetical protein
LSYSASSQKIKKLSNNLNKTKSNNKKINYKRRRSNNNKFKKLKMILPYKKSSRKIKKNLKKKYLLI